jgi:hypothetical protein
MGHQYVSRAKNANKIHGTTHEELNELLQGRGWIGKRRQPVKYLKALPVREVSSCSAGKA